MELPIKMKLAWRRLQLSYSRSRFKPSAFTVTVFVIVLVVFMVAPMLSSGPGIASGFRSGGARRGLTYDAATTAADRRAIVEKNPGKAYTAPCCAKSTCVLGRDDPKEVAAAVAAKSRSDRKLRIGFVTYATGPYNAFVEELWASLQELAFTRHDVHLFVFTDRAFNTSFLPHPRVHRKHQERLGWPFDSLARHFLFLRYLSW